MSDLKTIQQEMLTAIAQRLLKIILPAYVFSMIVFTVLTFFMEGFDSKTVWIVTTLTMIAAVVYYRGYAVTAARLLIITLWVGIFCMIYAYGTWRSFAGIGVTAVIIIWTALFLSRGITIISLGVLLTLYGGITLLVDAGIMVEILPPNPWASWATAVVIYSILLVTIVATTSLLFRLTAESQQSERQRTQALRDLQESRSFTLQALDNSRQLFGWVTPDGIIQFANSTALKLIHATLDQVIGVPLKDTPWFNTPDEKESLQAALETVRSGIAVQFETTLQNDSQALRMDVSMSPVYDDSGAMSFVITEARDITREKEAVEEQGRLRSQLHQSQKMEAVGQLAGGVAHDFNNVLGGIVGAAELLSMEETLSGDAVQYVDMIRSAAHRAGELTQQLLTFSRKGRDVTIAVDLRDILRETSELLSHTLDKNITHLQEVTADDATINGDPTALQHVLMNLGINASHAMPNGGTLTFSIENEELDDAYCDSSPFDILPGSYVVVRVRDTGIGMNHAVVDRIFEPFFTTKEQGKGTGLGLAAVYGTVQDHHGAITVYSEEGTGTVFHLYFPVSQQPAAAIIHGESIPRGNGTVLLIDDEELIRVTGEALLRGLGYHVVCAENGAEGVAIFAESPQRFDLILLDMIMPVQSGRETFAQIREMHATIPVVIASGFSKVGDVSAMNAQGVAGFLTKPFNKKELAQVVHEALLEDKGGV